MYDTRRPEVREMLAARGREDVDLEAVCRRHTHSVRDGRHFERRKSKESRVRLCYRH